MTGKACRQRRSERRTNLQWNDPATTAAEAHVSTTMTEARQRKTVQFEPSALKQEPVFINVRSSLAGSDDPEEEGSMCRRRSDSEPASMRLQSLGFNGIGGVMPDLPIELDGKDVDSDFGGASYGSVRVRAVTHEGQIIGGMGFFDEYPPQRDAGQEQQFCVVPTGPPATTTTHEVKPRQLEVEPAYIVVQNTSLDDEELEEEVAGSGQASDAVKRPLRQRSFTCPVQPEMTSNDPAFLIVRSTLLDVGKPKDHDWDADTVSPCSSDTSESNDFPLSSQRVPRIGMTMSQLEGAEGASFVLGGKGMGMDEPSVQPMRRKSMA